MSKKTVRDINLEGKKVIERCDFNVLLLEITQELLQHYQQYNIY